jgi:hypothetical protein
MRNSSDVHWAEDRFRHHDVTSRSLGAANIAPEHDTLHTKVAILVIVILNKYIPPFPTISNLHQLHSMSFLTRPASMLRSVALRPALSAAPRARQQVRWGTSDYGSGAGNPAGEKPEKQGANPSEGLEHPGPAPPDVAKGKSSSSPNEDSSKDTSQKSSKSSSNKGAQPKILNEKAPPEEEQSDDVKQHNKDMENRTETKHKQASDEDTKDEKVSKKYWAGK